MRHGCRNFAILSHQPGGEIGQTRFVCCGSGIAGSNPARAAKNIKPNMSKIRALEDDLADMLLSLNGTLRHVQAPFVDFDEIDKICKAHNRYDE